DAITASDQVVVSTDANNDVIAGVDGGAYYDDPDADATNEIQDITTDGSAGNLSLSSGSTLTLNVDDADADPTNEIQTAGTVNLDANLDVDGDGTNETNVQDALADITKVTSIAGRIFYPPSIAIEAPSAGYTGSYNLHAEYVAQFGSPLVRSDVGGANEAPASIPTYGANELYYYVTYYDSSVFSSITIDASGNMQYTIAAPPADYNALINVVFVVK
ncbi:hypothetical protein, partial [Robertkochia marina]